MKKVNIYLADGFEEIEALTVVDVLRRAGVEANTVAITNAKEVKGAHNITVIADKTFDEMDNNAADMLVLPGGMPGTTNLEKHEGLKSLIKQFYHEEKLIAAICAAPSILGKMELLESSRATCYPGFEQDLKGAIHSDDLVVRHKNIITSKGPGTALLFALDLVEILLGKEKMEVIKESMIVQK
ncbi:MAG: ThiJ family intracellular protease [Clostridia bacterium]|jgi:4-methyl-5(b-hydroxyethyl)-thiazole monophosphate biosynthesis|nr:ThiJ family intracellular protease [Clostridia bacterium]